MPIRFLLVLMIALHLANAGCGGGDKHLPSSNPPEYDPKKVYTTPVAPPSAPAVAKPAEPEQPSIDLPSLEPWPNEKGEWKKVPVNSDSLPLFKGIKGTCEALSKIVQGLGSAQLFAGAEGQALKKLLGTRAESLAQSLDQQLFETFKQQLGPGAVDCPSPAPTPARKSSVDDMLQQPHLMLATGSSHGSFQLAQATVPGGEREGYATTKGSVNINIPPDSVGRKSREWRIEEGNTPSTAGNRNGFTLVNGGYAKKCPTSEGIVEGDYEFSLIVHQTTTESGTSRTVYNARRVHAKLKGQVGDDAKLQYVDLDATLGIGRGGTDRPTLFSRQRQHVRFVPDHQASGLPSQFSNWSVSEWSSELVGATEGDSMTMLMLAVTIFSGPIYLDAELQWTTANTCVEITFTPATKTKKFVPSESTPVMTELRTKKERALVPAKFKEARERPREGNGRVSPREKESQPTIPATFTYQAPANRVKHSGFWVGAVSRAGVAEAKDGEWELADASYVLEFQSRIVSSEPTEPVESVAAGRVVLTPVEGKEGWYRGSGMLGYQTGPPPNRDPCTTLVMGHGTTPFDVAGMSIKLSERTDSAGHQTGSADIELHYLIHPTNETERPVAYVNYECVPGKVFPYPFFYSMYAVARGADEFNLLKGWTYVGRNGVVATKVLRGHCGDHCEDESVFTLKEVSDQTSSSK